MAIKLTAKNILEEIDRILDDERIFIYRLEDRLEKLKQKWLGGENNE